MSEDAMIERVKHEVALALGRAASGLDESQLLRRDLGAESIDLIDLTFRFEKILGKPLSENEIFKSGLTDGDVSLKEIGDRLITLQDPPAP